MSIWRYFVDYGNVISAPTGTSTSLPQSASLPALLCCRLPQFSSRQCVKVIGGFPLLLLLLLLPSLLLFQVIKFVIGKVEAAGGVENRMNGGQRFWVCKPL